MRQEEITKARVEKFRGYVREICPAEIAQEFERRLEVIGNLDDTDLLIVLQEARTSTPLRRSLERAAMRSILSPCGC